MSTPWWRGGVLYQVYPRSFADTTGDGVGDLAGVISRLDHIAWLGVDAIWLNPIYPSPNRDWGYDVSDYCDVDPELGTLADVDRLVREADARGLAVVLDLVPAHSSDRHPWFVESRAGRDSARRDWYLWADEPADDESTFGGLAWTHDEHSGQWYHHRFLPEQPDLNQLDPAVRDAFDEILRFWFERGIAGFRIDVAHELVKDTRGLVDRPAIHEVLRRWRRLADTFEPPRALLGETWVESVERLAEFYGDGTDELHLAFNFPFAFAGFDGMRDVIAETEAKLPANAWPALTLSNHDIVRFPTRLCDGDDRKVRAALALLLTLRATSVLYYGDELGMPQAEIPADRVVDVHGRDGARTPMPWGDGSWRDPWLPLDETVDVASQRDDPDSVLTLCRSLLALRRRVPGLREGGYEELRLGGTTWAWRRGEATVAANLADDLVAVELPPGTIRLSTSTGRGEQRVAGEVALAPWEVLVLTP